MLINFNSIQNFLRKFNPLNKNNYPREQPHQTNAFVYSYLLIRRDFIIACAQNWETLVLENLFKLLPFFAMYILCFCCHSIAEVISTEYRMIALIFLYKKLSFPGRYKQFSYNSFENADNF